MVSHPGRGIDFSRCLNEKGPCVVVWCGGSEESLSPFA